MKGSKPAERYRSGFGFMYTSNGLSPIAPPWTSLTAYDLNSGTIRWKSHWAMCPIWRPRESKALEHTFRNSGQLSRQAV